MSPASAELVVNRQGAIPRGSFAFFGSNEAKPRRRTEKAGGKGRLRVATCAQSFAPRRRSEHGRDLIIDLQVSNSRDAIEGELNPALLRLVA